MRGTVAKRLRREAQLRHLAANRLEPSKHFVERLTRKAGTVFRRTKARQRMIDGLAARGISPALAELMIPAIGDHGMTVTNTGVRATYRFLKQEYKRGQRIRFSD
jgi:phosphomannomutase